MAISFHTCTSTCISLSYWDREFWCLVWLIYRSIVSSIQLFFVVDTVGYFPALKWACSFFLLISELTLAAAWRSLTSYSWCRDKTRGSNDFMSWIIHWYLVKVFSFDFFSPEIFFVSYVCTHAAASSISMEPYGVIYLMNYPLSEIQSTS